MNVSLYQAASALQAMDRWQETIAENLASASVPGFKKQEVSFEAVQAGRHQLTNAPTVRQGVLESANPSVVREMANLMVAMRTFEANQRMAQLHDDRMSRAINDLTAS